MPSVKATAPIAAAVRVTGSGMENSRRTNARILRPANRRCKDARARSFKSSTTAATAGILLSGQGWRQHDRIGDDSGRPPPGTGAREHPAPDRPPVGAAETRGMVGSRRRAPVPDHRRSRNRQEHDHGVAAGLWAGTGGYNPPRTVGPLAR